MKIETPQMLLPVLKKWRNKRQEHFIVCTLTTSNELIKANTITIGIVNSVMVHPREVFWQAIKYNAASIVVAHNHPSGDCTPSVEDELMTMKLLKASKIMEIPLLDHVIVTKDSYYSFKEDGKIKNDDK